MKPCHWSMYRYVECWIPGLDIHLQNQGDYSKTKMDQINKLEKPEKQLAAWYKSGVASMTRDHAVVWFPWCRRQWQFAYCTFTGQKFNTKAFYTWRFCAGMLNLEYPGRTFISKNRTAIAYRKTLRVAGILLKFISHTTCSLLILYDNQSFVDPPALFQNSESIYSAIWTPTC